MYIIYVKNIWNKTNIFSQLTEHTSYLLGLWYSDGGIGIYRDKRRVNSYQKVFTIYNTDYDIIEWVSDFIHCKIMVIPPKKVGWLTSYQVKIQSTPTVDFLYNLVKTTSKSTMEVPLPQISDELFHHFIRGFFDGDGSIHIKHYKTRHGKPIDALQTSFTAGKDTGNFLGELKNRLRSLIPVGDKKINAGKTNKKLQFNAYDSMLLCEWMYKDATIFIKRKKAIWDNCDKERIVRGMKFFSNKV